MAAARVATSVPSSLSRVVPSLTKKVAATSVTNSVLLPGQTTVIPRWWQGSYETLPIHPSEFVIDGANKISSADLHPDSLLGREVIEKYNKVGLVHVKNTGLQGNMQDQRNLARLLMGEESEYNGGANARGRHEELGNVYDIGAPLTAALAYHHEMTYKEHSISQLGFLCKHAPPLERVMGPDQVGWSFVSDSVQAHDFIMTTPLGQKLKEKGICFVRRMTDATTKYDDASSSSVIYNHWQTSWMTNDPAEAQAKAEEQGLTVEWVPLSDAQGGGHLMQTRYYIDAFEYIPQLDRNILVTSIADDGEWFDSWPGICDVPQEARPLEMYFGDDTPLSLEEKQLWTDAYDMFGIPLPWQAGDVAVLCNMRYAHGRPGVHLLPGEQRELGVMLGPYLGRKESLADKW